jgi:hypothetical protein
MTTNIFFLEMGCPRPLHQSIYTAVLLRKRGLDVMSEFLGSGTGKTPAGWVQLVPREKLTEPSFLARVDA